MRKTALLSAYDKTGLADFARSLHQLGWHLLGSAGTAKHLTEHGIPIQDVAEIVGQPILGHKVVTLSREVHAALLADDSPEEQEELNRIGIPRIDLVYVDLYPLKEEIAKLDHTPESVRAKTDIGGPTMLRSAAKGRRIVVSSNDQLDEVLRHIYDVERGAVDPTQAKKFVSQYAAMAEAVVARYCQISSAYLYSSN